MPSSARSRVAPGGAAAVVAAAALWGSTGTAAHFAPAAATPVAIGAARIVIGGALLLIIGLCWPDPGRHAAPGGHDAGRGAAMRDLVAGSGRRRAVLAAGALSVAGYQVCFFSAVHATGVAIGTLVTIGSGPVWAGAISGLTGVARPGLRWLLATAAAIAGCAILLGGGSSAGVQLPGVGLALAAGLCYACYAVCAASLITAGAGHRPVMAALFGGGAVVLLPVLLTGPDGWLFTVRGAVVVAELSVLTTLVAYLLYGRGLRTVPAPTAVTLGLAEPVVAAILAVVILHERLSGVAVAGLLLIACALAVLAVPGRPAGRLRENQHHG